MYSLNGGVSLVDVAVGGRREKAVELGGTDRLWTVCRRAPLIRPCGQKSPLPERRKHCGYFHGNYQESKYVVYY